MAIFEGFKGREDIIDIDMETGTVHRSFSNRRLGENDLMGDLFGVRLIKNGEPMELTGATVSGLFIRADGDTVPFEGDKFENTIAYVILPAGCYVVPGQFQLSIIIATQSTQATVRIIDGTVVQTAKGSAIDPGTGDVIPDMEGLNALLTQLQNALLALSEYYIETTQISGTRYRLDVGLPEVSS